MNLVTLHRLAHALYKRRVPIAPRVVSFLGFALFNSSVPPSVEIGRGTRFAYGGIGCVIHARARIGRNCIIGQGITIGGRSKHPDVPIIGDNVYIGAGARILGPITVGSEVVIGPNAVVIKDIPNGSIVVGIPGRIIKSGILMRDYV